MVVVDQYLTIKINISWAPLPSNSTQCIINNMKHKEEYVYGGLGKTTASGKQKVMFMRLINKTIYCNMDYSYETTWCI